MTPRRRRMLFVAAIVATIGVAATFALSAFRDNVLFYYTPTQLATEKTPQGRALRIGGMVSEGSVKRVPGSLEVNFVVTDFAHDLAVKYSGVLPDLFREGQGVIVRGRLVSPSEFLAEEVLAKHDEKYMPPDVAESVRKAHAAKVATQTTQSSL
jgi:cytochrome c-type biogenesis protein CcmE